MLNNASFEQDRHFSKSIHAFLVNLKRHYPEQLKQVDPEIVDKYLPKKALACLSIVKPSEPATTLEQVSRDLFSLVQQFSADQQKGLWRNGYAFVLAIPMKTYEKMFCKTMASRLFYNILPQKKRLGIVNAALKIRRAGDASLMSAGWWIVQLGQLRKIDFPS